MIKLLLGLTSLIFATSAFAKVEAWVIDDSHSSARFEVSHLVISTVEGTFKKFGGEIQFGVNEFKRGNQLSKMRFDLWAQTDSIDTGNDKRDKHLKSDDFFNSGKKGHKKIVFVSKRFKKKGGKKFELVGDLKMNGVTKEVTFEGKYNGTVTAYEKKRIGLELEAEIERAKWGLEWNNVVEAGPVIGDEVEIVLNIQAHRKADL